MTKPIMMPFCMSSLFHFSNHTRPSCAPMDKEISKPGEGLYGGVHPFNVPTSTGVGGLN